jgi:hypothetical protein
LCAWYIWIILEHQKKILKGKVYGKPVVKQNQEELLLNAEYERLEEISRGQD